MTVDMTPNIDLRIVSNPLLNGIDYSQEGSNYYHNSKYQTRDRDNWHYKYRGYGDKSPRRDYKKAYQKYSNETEGVRNLSHCEMPSPPKKKIEDESNVQREKNGIIEGLNSFVTNIVSNKFPQSGPYQNIFQNQQNINIKISLTSSGQLRNKPKEKESKDKETQFANEDRKISIEEDEFIEPKPLLPPPQSKIDLVPFDKSTIKIEKNPFDSIKPIPSIETNEVFEHMDGSSMQIKPTETASLIKLSSCYLLAKIPNWRLVTNYVPGALLSEEKFKRIPKNEDIKGKSYLLYDAQIEKRIEQITEHSKPQVSMLKNEINIIRKGIERYENEINGIKMRLFSNEFNNKMDTIKLEEINTLLSNGKIN